MGYSTDFTGSFKLDKPLSAAQIAYLTKFSETRRMARDASKTAGRPDPIREAVGLPVGAEGGYFVGAGGDFGQEGWDVPDITNYNEPSTEQPGLWCQWVPTSDGTAIKWNGAEKFYKYVEWLKYLIEHFLKPWGYVLNGKVTWQGEHRGDAGVLKVEGNVVTWELC